MALGENEFIIRIIQEAGNLPGISWYCDRWCLRCQFTARCGLYIERSRIASENGGFSAEESVLWQQRHY